MRLWNWLTRRRPDHGWPGFIINGRIRTSTVALILAFFVISWVHNTYQPAPQAVVPKTAQVVPPGFVPDPEYTWVPRTNVEPRPPVTSTTPTTTTTTTPTSPTETTGPAPTTFVDPDGPGPLPPTPVAPTSTSTTVSTSTPTTVTSPVPVPTPLTPPR